MCLFGAGANGNHAMQKLKIDAFTRNIPVKPATLVEGVRRIATDLMSLVASSPTPEVSLADRSALIGYAANPSSRGQGARPEGAIGPFGANPLRTAKRLIAERSTRAKYFDASYFGEAAWDMLLDLYVAYHSKIKVAVSSLCIASRVPPTTALRALRALTDEGTIIRTLAKNDKRIVYLELTPLTEQKLTNYFIKIEPG
jgi:DNA-binding MarR family transcriptional regulator